LLTALIFGEHKKRKDNPPESERKRLRALNDPRSFSQFVYKLHKKYEDNHFLKGNILAEIKDSGFLPKKNMWLRWGVGTAMYYMMKMGVDVLYERDNNTIIDRVALVETKYDTYFHVERSYVHHKPMSELVPSVAINQPL